MNPLHTSNNSNKPKIILNPVGTLIEQDKQSPIPQPITNTIPIPKLLPPPLISINVYILHRHLVVFAEMLMRAEYINEQVTHIINDFFMKRIWVLQLLIGIKTLTGYMYREIDTMKSINYILVHDENTRSNIEKYLKNVRIDACSNIYISRYIQTIVNYFYKIENLDSTIKIIVDGFLQERISLKELIDTLSQNFNINKDTIYYIIFTTKLLKKTNSFRFIAGHLNYLRNQKTIDTIQIEEDEVIIIEEDDVIIIEENN